MNTRTFPNRLAMMIAIAAATLASTHVIAQDEATMTVDATSPIAATLMPTVSVFADASNPDAPPQWHVADTRPLPVTLMPTVRVTAQAEVLAVTLLPTVRVHAPAAALAWAEPAAARPAMAQAPAVASTVRVATTQTVADALVDRVGRSGSQRNLEVSPR